MYPLIFSEFVSLGGSNVSFMDSRAYSFPCTSWSDLRAVPLATAASSLKFFYLESDLPACSDKRKYAGHDAQGICHFNLLESLACEGFIEGRAWISLIFTPFRWN